MYLSLYVSKDQPILFDVFIVLCIIIGCCGNKTGKSLKKKDLVRFSHVSKIEKNEGEMTEELPTRRRRAWLSTISHDDLTEGKLENERFVIGIVCLARLPNAGINMMLTGA